MAHPIGVGRLNKCTATLDRCFLPLEVLGTPGASHVWDFMPGVPDDNLLAAAQKVGVQKVFDRFDCAILVGLLLDEHRPRNLAYPVPGVQVLLQRREETVRALGWHTSNLPLVNLLRPGVDEAHREVLYPDVDR